MPYFPPANSIITNTATNSGAANKKVNSQTGTNYTLQAGDSSALITLTNTAPITVTIPSNKAVSFPTGTIIELVQLGAGQVNVTGEGITISSKDNQKQLKAQFSQATLLKTGGNDWVLTGDLAEVSSTP